MLLQTMWSRTLQVSLFHGAPPIIADFLYVTSLLAALNSLLMDNHHAFVLTVDTYTVAIYRTVCLTKFLILIEEIY